jgi:hypothetical protein
MYRWQMEYSFGAVRCRFFVMADTFEDAIREGNAIMSGMRRSATYKSK